MKMKLTCQQGIIDNKSLHEVLHLLIEPIPEIVWIEPRPFLMETTKLYAPIEFWGLQVLQQDEHDWHQKILSSDIMPEEACLYWHDRFCHLLDTPKGCRWFYGRENEDEFEVLAPTCIPKK
ncbi:hypothetical protein BGP_1997 [Beggiatoa sp. PS]|nr:hypothetical protein BGP_1997 [Beggiatoa sp. PS]